MSWRDWLHSRLEVPHDRSFKDFLALSLAADHSQLLLEGEVSNYDEGKALQAYLAGETSVHDTAQELTAKIPQASDANEGLYYMWYLIVKGIADSPEDREALLGLLRAIQCIPASRFLNWQELPEFGFVWSEHCGEPARLEHVQIHDLSDEEIEKLRWSFQEEGKAEAQLYLTGNAQFSYAWYEIIAEVSLGRPYLDILIAKIYGWLSLAAATLKHDLEPGEVRTYPAESNVFVTATMEEHWERWTKNMLVLSSEHSLLDQEGRQLARKCHEYLRGSAEDHL